MKAIVLISFVGGLVLTLASQARTIPIINSQQTSLITQDNTGQFWGTDPNNGNSARQVVSYRAGFGGSLQATPYSGSFIPNLTPNGNPTAHGLDGNVEFIWPLPDGNVLFATEIYPQRSTYLYKLKPSTNTVGNNPPYYNNKQAIINTGERGNGPQADIRFLHHRSLLVANFDKGTANEKPVLYYGEYNVGKKPEVALWRSWDLGDTWSKVITWNTVGKQTFHIHGVVQNPYTGWIYILLGDADSEAGIIAWDGKSPAPPDNTPIANMGNYPGWKAIAGSQQVRTGDLVFSPPPLGKCIWIPDVDTIPPGTKLHGQRANYDLTGLESTGEIPYTDGNPPILGAYDVHQQVIYWASFRIQDSIDPSVHIWQSDDTGLTWSLAAKTKVYNSYTSVPQNLYMAQNQLILSARGMELTPTGLSKGSHVAFSPLSKITPPAQ